MRSQAEIEARIATLWQQVDKATLAFIDLAPNNLNKAIEVTRTKNALIGQIEALQWVLNNQDSKVNTD